MDPLSITAIAAFAIQVVDFSAKIISKSKDVRNRAEILGNEDLRIITEDLSAVCDKLNESLAPSSDGTNVSPNGAAIQALGKECKELGAELLVGLKKLTGRAGQSTWKSFRLALLHVWHASRITDFEQRIDKFRQQLILRLLDSLREQIQTQYKKQTDQSAVQERKIREQFLEHLRDTAKLQDQFVGQIEKRLVEAIQGPVVEPREISQPPEKTRKSMHLRFLQGLRFEEIGERRGRIPVAFQRTFEWIYRDPDPGLNCTWSSFVGWLENGEGTYWITGKPGSGKSTIMKFLENDERTKQHLRNWSGNHQLITAGFYFWNSGTELQMSIPGLLRSLLYLVLQQHPDLILLLCPDRWEELNLFSDAEPRPWTTGELRRVLLRFSREQFSHLRFFFLIDGLDEFIGDHGELIDLIRDLVDCKHIKVCVASRPWVVFQEVFDKLPNFMLQYLTAKDIEIFVRSAFNDNERFRQMQGRNPQRAEKFLTEVMERSSGVFLWVRLVTKSLLRGISSRDKMSDLQKRLDELPANLEDLFGKILDNIEPRYLEHATELFRIHGSHPSISALRMSFADEEADEICTNGRPDPLTMGELAYRCDEIKQRVDSRTMGLLELNRHDKYTSQDYNSKATVGTDVRNECRVQYLHRTVKDFIEQEHVWERIVQTSPAFDPYLSLCKAMVLEAKTWDPTRVLPRHLCNFVQLALRYASAASNNSHGMLIPLLDSLEKIVSARFQPQFDWKHLDAKPEQRHHCLILPWALQLDLDFWVKHLLDHGHPVESREGFSSYLSFTMDPGSFTDVDQELSRNARVLNGRKPVRERCLRLLLDRGASIYRRQGEEPLWKYVCFEIARCCSILVSHRPKAAYKRLSDEEIMNMKNDINHWVDAILILREHGIDISLLCRLIPKSTFARMRHSHGLDLTRLQTVLIVEAQALPGVSNSPRLLRLSKLNDRRKRLRDRRNWALQSRNVKSSGSNGENSV